MSQYQDALDKFESILINSSIEEEIQSIIESGYEKNCNVDVLKQIFSCADYTSLSPFDTEENVTAMAYRVNDVEDNETDLPSVASICVYPNLIAPLKQSLMAQSVAISTVAGGYPSAQTFTEVKVAEVSMSVMETADEVEIVMGIGTFMQGDYDMFTEEIQEVKDACREAKLKVVLETGALKELKLVKESAVLVLYCGADFLVTSTGSTYGEITDEVVYMLCRVLKQYRELTGRQKGIKIAGGVSSVESLVRFYTIVKDLLGDTWLTPEFLRFDMRAELLDELQQKIRAFDA